MRRRDAGGHPRPPGGGREATKRHLSGRGNPHHPRRRCQQQRGQPGQTGPSGHLPGAGGLRRHGGLRGLAGEKGGHLHGLRSTLRHCGADQVPDPDFPRRRPDLPPGTRNQRGVLPCGLRSLPAGRCGPFADWRGIPLAPVRRGGQRGPAEGRPGKGRCHLHGRDRRSERSLEGHLGPVLPLAGLLPAQRGAGVLHRRHRGPPGHRGLFPEPGREKCGGEAG